MSACSMLSLAGVLVADAVCLGGSVVDDEDSCVAAALAVFAFPMYLLKQMGLRWPVLPQWLHTSLS